MIVKVANLPDSGSPGHRHHGDQRPAAASETDGYVVPDRRKLDRKLAAFLVPSPQIESNHEAIRAAAGEFSDKKLKAWDRVKAIYDWVQKKIEYEDNQGKAVLSAVEALNAGKGDCDEMSALFIAVCRASGVPARMVRVPGHVYSEFYLLDDEGRGHWFPCQSAGTPSFGTMPDLRPILQRGDNVLMLGPDPRNKKRVRYRFFPENVTGMPVGAAGAWSGGRFVNSRNEVTPCKLAVCFWRCCCGSAWRAWLRLSSGRDGKSQSPQPGTVSTQRRLTGLVVTAEGGTCRNLLGTAPVPIQWPEQEVHAGGRSEPDRTSPIRSSKEA